MSKCQACGRAVSGASLCVRCEGGLTVALAQVPALAEELALTVTRQTAMGSRNGSRSSEKPLPVNLDAAEVADNLKATLVGWVRDLEADTQFQPRNDLMSVAGWLQSRMPEIRVHIAADTLHDEVTYAIREAWRAVDRPANRSRVKVGQCLEVSCTGSLTAFFPVADYDPDNPETHAKMTCSACDASYPAAQWLNVGRRLLARSA